MTNPSEMPVGDTPSDRLKLYETMVRIRELETGIESLHYGGRMHGSFHSSMGQEAAAAGVIGCLRPTDLVTSTHRGHGHAIAKGMRPTTIIAELLGLQQGSSGGKGGSMHLHDVACGFLGENAIVAGGVPWAAGAAWASRRLGKDLVAVSFVGDGGVAQGVLAETLRMARTWGTPLLVACENNHLAHSMPVERTFGEPGSIAGWAAGFGMRAEYVAGDDVFAVHRMAAEMIDEVRATGRAAFVEIEAWRIRAHSLNDPDYRYLAKDLGKSYLQTHDPIANAERDLPLTEADATAIRERIAREIAEAIDAAFEGQAAPVRSATTGVYSEAFEQEGRLRGW
ncbi:MAG: thiamine pyrophosphate-dependent dehydrogenase E1 component subunit alpha [Acidimicrobiaceae bacterium]|nr:thiamine pyrophosphate-dependent dehydrogenase E1 component subunit alpha [Acidimicrobiaceae bacterium]